MGGTPLVALIYLSRLEQPLWMGIQIAKLEYGCVIFHCHLDWQRVQPFGRWIAPAATGTLCWQLDVLSPLRAENRPGIQSPLGSDFFTLLLDLPHSCLVLQHAAGQSGSSFQSTMVQEIKLYLKEKWKTFKMWWMILFRCKGKSAQNHGFCSFPPHKTGGVPAIFPLALLGKTQCFTRPCRPRPCSSARHLPSCSPGTGDQWRMNTLWWTYKKQWKMAIEIVDFPINSMVIFHGKMLVHQRVMRSSAFLSYQPLMFFKMEKFKRIQTILEKGPQKRWSYKPI